MWQRVFVFYFPQNPLRVIRALALDPGGSWLACACMDTNVYIVPVGAVAKVCPVICVCVCVCVCLSLSLSLSLKLILTKVDYEN